MPRRALVRRRMVPTLAGALLGTLLGGCGPDPIVTPVRNLERPTDMDFVCLSTPEGSRIATGRPMAVCRNPTSIDPDPDELETPRVRGTFALVTNSARSEVGAIDLRRQRLVDLDPAIPGFNQIPVGSLPEVLSTSDDGCRAVTANRGSCDLSVINTTRALARAMGASASPEDTTPVVSQIRVKTARGELRAAPHEVAFVPTLPPEVVATGDGPACGADPAQTWRAVVTFPSCDLVALVSFPEGRLLSSVRVLADGQVVNAGDDPVCPADCGSLAPTDGGSDASAPPDLALADGVGPEAAPAADAGASDALTAGGGGPQTDTAAPPSGAIGAGAIAIMPRGDRMYVGSTRSENVAVVGIGPAGFLAAPEGPIRLSERPGGVTRLRLSLNPFGPPEAGGSFVGNRGQYLYAFARDGSVRVVEIGDRNGALLPNPGECDVNIDFDKPGYDASRGCFRVEEKRPRLLLEKGPGLRVPVRFDPEVAAPVPIDIAFGQLGTFGIGMLLASNGRVYQIAVDPPTTTDATTPVVQPPHTPRPSAPGTGTRAGGPPRLNGEPIRSFTETPLAFPTKVGFASAELGPRFESYRNPMEDNQGDIQRFLRFSRSSAVPEEVEVRWEGLLPVTTGFRPRATGRLLPAGAPGDSVVGVLRDVGADYCRVSVEKGDLLSVAGCDQDLDCDATDDETCYRVSPGAQGTCLPRSFVANESLVRTCRAELASRRRYEILEVRKRQLVLGLKLDEVPRPSLKPCSPDLPAGAPNVCQPDVAHQPDPTIAGDEGFRCLELRAGEPRCLKRCGVRDDSGAWQLNDDLCRAGHVCADLGHATLGPLCVEAPPPRAECTPRDARYRIQAGKSFLVASLAVPYFVTHREQPVSLEPAGRDPAQGGLCVPDTTIPKLFSQRIPLSAPHCQTVSDGARARRPNAEGSDPDAAIDRSPANEPFGANACLFLGPNEGDPDDVRRVKALFENPHYRFVLTNLEDYVGDAAVIRADVVGGFSPLVAANTGGTLIGLGARIVASPVDSDDTGVLLNPFGEPSPPPPFFFVVDQGRTLTQFSRGQVLRINPRPLESLQGGYTDSIETGSLFPIQ